MQAWTFALAAACLCSSAVAQITFPVEAPPPPTVGDRWKAVGLDGLTRLQTGWHEETVTAVDADYSMSSVVTDRGEQAPVRYDAHLNAIRDVHGSLEREIKLVFPLEPGKTWDSRWKWINPRGHDGRMEMTYKVSGVERVRVPAGEFDAVVIDGRGSWYNTSRHSTGVVVERRWYAPSVQRIVRRTWVTRYSNGQPDQNMIVEMSEITPKK